MTPAVITFQRIIRITQSSTDINTKNLYKDITDYYTANRYEAWKNYDETQKQIVKSNIQSVISSSLTKLYKELPLITDESCNLSLKFKAYELNIVELDASKPYENLIKVSCISEPYTLLGTIGDAFLIAEGDISSKLKESVPVVKKIYRLKPSSECIIYSYLAIELR